MAEYTAIATWIWGQTAVRAAADLLEKGHSALDAVVAGGQAVEDDPDVRSVGYGGMANSIGTVTLDACVMEGKTLNCGAVAGVENIRHVAAVSRRVMERTPHILLVGQGAQQFAMQQGFSLETLHTPESVAEWEEIRPTIKPGQLQPNPGEGRPHDHDTVTVLARDSRSDLAGCCTTSGLGHKLPGRVGDSPLIGHGLFVDNTAGAAGGTGVGEEVMRIVGSSFIVEQMRAGATAQAACEAAVKRVNALAVRRGVHPARVAFIALDTKGNPGACSTVGSEFHYAVARPGKLELIKAKEIGPEHL